MKGATVVAAGMMVIGATGLTDISNTAEATELKRIAAFKDRTGSTARNVIKTIKVKAKSKKAKQVGHKRKSGVKKSARRQKYLAMARAVKPLHLPLDIVDAVISMESGYRPGVTGAAGEVGLMQIKPATARLVRRKFGIKAASLRDPNHNLRVGTALLGHCYRKAKGNIGATIGCYNAGEGNMWRWQKFAVTRKYVRYVRSRVAQN